MANTVSPKYHETPYRHSLKERILETAMEQFAQRGIRAVRMDDLAQTLGISKRTLYEIYSNKEDLLFEGVKKYYAKRLEDQKRIVSGAGNVMDILLMLYHHSVAELKQVVPSFYSDMERYPKVMAFLQSEQKQRFGERRAFLERGVEEGYFRKDVNLDLALHFFEVIGIHALREKYFTQYSIDDIYNSIVFLSLRGLCTERGQKRMDQFFAK
jgi:AcrR family transcriptional regulator